MKTPIVVTGLRRCGASAVLAMLRAAGIPIHEGEPNPGHDAWFDFLLPGSAFKLLEPQIEANKMPPQRPLRIIMVTRDHVQQALSEKRHFEATMGRRGTQVRLIQAGLARDEPRAMETLRSRQRGSEFLHVRFEHIVTNPRHAATMIQQFLGLPVEAIEPMAAVVEKRSPRCKGRAA